MKVGFPPFYFYYDSFYDLTFNGSASMEPMRITTESALMGRGFLRTSRWVDLLSDLESKKVRF